MIAQVEKHHIYPSIVPSFRHSCSSKLHCHRFTASPPQLRSSRAPSWVLHCTNSTSSTASTALAPVHPSKPSKARPLDHSTARLHHHLGDTRTTKSLRTHKLLTLKRSSSIEQTSQSQQNRSSDQGSRLDSQAKPLNQSSGEVESSSSPEGVELADCVVENFGCGTDAQQEGDLEED